MSRSWVGRSLTERFYVEMRRLALGLAYLVKALWKAFGLDGGNNSPGVVASWLDRMIDLLEYYHELSLAKSHEYFVGHMLVDNTSMLLSPRVDADGEPFRARWGAMDTRVDEGLEVLAQPILHGRVAEVPGAAEQIVDERAYAEVHDVSHFPRVAAVMGDEFAGGLVEESDEPEVVDEPEGFDPPVPEPEDPIVLVPDTGPVSENNARTRLQIKGPDNLEKQVDALRHAEYLDEDEVERRIADKSDKSWVRATNAATTLADGANDFVHAAAVSQGMGVVRVLGPNPCAFCVALAALGVIYEQGAWDDSDGKFRKWMSKTGKPMRGGNAKVHDGCQCRLEPVPLGADESMMPAGVAEAQALWRRATGKMPERYSWTEKYNAFRQMFRSGEFVNEDMEFERPVILDKRDELRMQIPGEMIQVAFLEQYDGEDDPTPGVATLEQTLMFHRQHLEYLLQQWEKYEFEETTWEREYEWMLKRAAAMTPEPGRLRVQWMGLLTNPTMQRHFDMQMWVGQQYPEYQTDRWRKHFFGGSEVGRLMPEFD